MAKILIIDDEPIFCLAMTDLIQSFGHDVKCSETVRSGLRQARSEPYDLILLDVILPDGNGLDYISELRSTSAGPEIIIMTSTGTPEGAEKAITDGAWDYLVKNSADETVQRLIERSLKYRENKLRYTQQKNLDREHIIGNSQRIQQSLELVAQAAGNNSNVLITGETGTGKEVFARAIHYNSPRAKNKFVVIDCTNIPDTLAESILFGHRKGAFTGANEDKEGLFREADGGTVFLDEIGDLPMSIQKSLLRVLQERSFRPVGSSVERSSNFRLIAATNRDLEQMVERGRFRNDLYYRLRTLTIALPSLSERSGDITLLVRHYVPRICREHEVEEKQISDEFLEYLKRYDWPGNVRELVNSLYKSVSNAADERVLFPHHVPREIRAAVVRNLHQQRAESGEAPTLPAESMMLMRNVYDDLLQEDELPTLKEVRELTVATMERDYLRELIRRCEGSIDKACSMSDLSRARVYQLCKKYDMYLKR